MSRLAKKPIVLPDAVKASVQETTLSIEGPLGILTHAIPQPISLLHDPKGKTIAVKWPPEDERGKALAGTTWSIITNMVKGVIQGYEKQLEINGVGYNAKIQGKQLVLQLGFSHAIQMDIPASLTVLCPSQTAILVKGSDKQLVGEFAAEVRSKREVEPYNLKGIKYRGEVVKKKAGKTFVSGSTS